MAEHERRSFPLPQSGSTRIVKTGDDTFNVECTGLDQTDNKMMEGFFCACAGRFKAFRFQFGDAVYAECRFDSDAVPFEMKPSDNKVVLPIKILAV
jgi:hypothetical protein